jgi:uncharacterized protein YprB with RNaseH-like and TPR domain
MGTRLQPVAFDIETTGFTVEDRVTVAGFELPLGVRLFLNAAGRPVDSSLETDLQSAGDVPVQLSTHADERTLLEALGSFVAETVVDRDYLLVAYNGERWRSGFDLPFLRTRLAAHDDRWPFVDVPYADLMPIFDRRFQTVRADGTTVTDLVGVYEAVDGGDLGRLDHFPDSEAAVEAFETGEFEALLGHNLADVRRTARLAALAERFCSKAEFNVKSLTPTSEDPSLQG